MNDEEYGKYAKDKTYLFSLMEEAIGKRAIKDNWLGWKEEEFSFTNKENLKDFYKLVIGDKEKDADNDPVISNPNHMRKFVKLLEGNKNTQVMGIIDGTLDVEEAYHKAFPTKKVPIKEVLSNFIDEIGKLETDEVEGLGQDEIKMLEQIKKLVVKRAKQHLALKAIDTDEDENDE
ncbi:hypothetical protein LCL89_14180 [Halobacillus yeomjeoni]|uniref:hypothetical protein n=1 Tax=Halobacillus yeomjeoni TaxID=311194 RepID=UPI001CD4FAA4|nr:hypothetical protein [Halobacillus yeomjeoni]MCA0985176.1 hypothetical protein [Halobacillus yeomjeoni]